MRKIKNDDYKKKKGRQEWWLLVEQMTQCLADDERFWRNAMADMLSGAGLVRVCEGGRMASSEAQMCKFRKIAVDYKDDRFRAELAASALGRNSSAARRRNQ